MTLEWAGAATTGLGRRAAEAIRACLSNGATLEAAVDVAHEVRKLDGRT